MNPSVIRDDSPFIKQAIVDNHYLHRWPDPRSLPFAYRLMIDGQDKCEADNRPFGMVVFKKPQHHAQRGLFGYPGLPTSWQVLDLARVWVNPHLQGHWANGHSLCVFSQMVALCLRRVQWDWLEHHPPRFPSLPYHIELIISYCQLDHHDGTAYRACSFTSAGLTNDRAKEVYWRRLKPPHMRWETWRNKRDGIPPQQPLFTGMALPLIHAKEI